MRWAVRSITPLLCRLLYPFDYLSYWLYFTFVSKSLSETSRSLSDGSSSRRVLVLSPHQDDEALGCAGLLLSLPDVEEICVVFASDGAGQRDKRPAAAREKLSRERYREARVACAGLGAAEPVFLGFEDGSLQTETGLPEAIAQQIERFAPDMILAPFVTDAPADHIAVTQALSSIDDDSLAGSEIVLYQVHSQIPAALCNRYVALSDNLHERKMEVLRSYESQGFTDCLTMNKYLLMSRQIPSVLRDSGTCSIERYVSLDARKLRVLFDRLDGRRLAGSLNYSPFSFAVFLKNERRLAKVFSAL